MAADPEKLPQAISDRDNSTSNNDSPSPDASSSFKQLSFLDRFLAAWIFIAMAFGILLGNFHPPAAAALQRGSFVGVSIPIAIGLLIMMYPILLKVRYESLPTILRDRQLWRHLSVSLFVNWIICSLLMLGLAWAFLPDRSALREGLIIVGIARCIAMVLIWNSLAGGDGDYCALLVAVNSLLQIALFAPLAVFYISVVSRADNTLNVPYAVVAKSVAVFLGIPLAAAVVTRFALLHGVFRGNDARWQKHFVRWVAPWSLIGLLFTIVVLFAGQSRNVVGKITSVLRVIPPLILYFLLTFGMIVAWARLRGRKGQRGEMKTRWGYGVTAAQSLTAASNNFELAIAVAVACYGAESEQALAATVGPLVEVPVLLGLVEVLKWGKKRWRWDE